MIKILIITCFILCTANSYGQSQNNVVGDNEFLGIQLGVTTIPKADSILKAISYKEPKKYIRHIRWREGGCSTTMTTHYSIKLSQTKMKVYVRGMKTADLIEVKIEKAGKGLPYQAIVLGKMKVKELEKVSKENWRNYYDFNGKRLTITNYQQISVGVETEENKGIENKKITQLILTKKQ